MFLSSFTSFAICQLKAIQTFPYFLDSSRQLNRCQVVSPHCYVAPNQINIYSNIFEEEYSKSFCKVKKFHFSFFKRDQRMILLVIMIILQTKYVFKSFCLVVLGRHNLKRLNPPPPSLPPSKTRGNLVPESFRGKTKMAESVLEFSYNTVISSIFWCSFTRSWIA